MMDIYFALSDNADEEAAGRGRRAAPQAQAFAIPPPGARTSTSISRRSEN
jgi:hypothetical protein